MEKYAEKWMEGFCEEAQRLGLNKEAAAELLQFTAMLEKAGDASFRKAFGETYMGLMKEAGGASTLPGKIGDIMGTHFGGFLRHPAGASAATALGLGGLGAGYLAVAPKWGMGKMEQDMYWANKAYQAGLLDEEGLMNRYNQLARGKSKSLRYASGFGMDENPWQWAYGGAGGGYRGGMY